MWDKRKMHWYVDNDNITSFKLHGYKVYSVEMYIWQFACAGQQATNCLESQLPWSRGGIPIPTTRGGI